MNYSKYDLLEFFKKKFEPYKFRLIKKYTKNKPLNVLDVGCGFRSAQVARKWLNVKNYDGIDRIIYLGDQNSYNSIDNFYKLDLDTSDLAQIKNNSYDLIICSHVIEHLHNTPTLISTLIQKLKSSGLIYIETPSKLTLNYPSAIGFLNFNDDPTHVKFYSDAEISTVLQCAGSSLIYSGYRRDWFRIILLSPIGVMLNILYYLPFKRKISSYGLWDLLGVAWFWLAIKK